MIATLACVTLVAASTPAFAGDDPTPTEPTLLTPEPAATADSLEGLSAPVRDIEVPVRDIVTVVESAGGDETREDTGERRTLILTSGVLFAEESSKVTKKAHKRLEQVAEEIDDSGATGKVQIDGYTDDQGSAKFGLKLSRQRAQAVRKVLTPLLEDADVELRTKGHGEADPRFPNKTEDGDPIPKNRAKNRRVEITFRPAGG